MKSKALRDRKRKKSGEKSRGKNPSVNRPEKRDNYASARGAATDRLGSVGSASRGHNVYRVCQHPMVGRIFRAHVPYCGRTRMLLFRIVDAGTSTQQGEVLRVQTLPLLGVQFRSTRWVTSLELAMLVKVGLAEAVTSLPCDRCGGVMAYISDGEVNNKPQPFFACTGCENCVVV